MARENDNWDPNGKVITADTWAGEAPMMAGAPVKDYSASAIARMFLSGADTYPGGSLTGGPSKPFSQSLWVYRCISAIATNVARVPLRLSVGEAGGTRAYANYKHVRCGRRSGGAQRSVRKGAGAHLKAREGEIVEGGPLYDLLARPNPEQTWCQMALQAVGLQYCAGRVHWLFDEMIGRRPLTIYAVSGARTRARAEDAGRVQRLTGWTFRNQNGIPYPVALDEVITFQLFNPDSPYAGLAPKDPANLAIVSDYNASTYNAAMFGNSAEPGGLLKTDAPYNADLDQQMRTAWHQRHRGAANARAMAILWGGLDWKSVASTMKDMQYREGKQMSREEMCAGYGVPASVAGFFGRSGDAAAYVSAELERFWQDTVMPLLDSYAEGVNVHLCPRFEGALEAWFDVEDVPVVQAMRLSKLKAGDSLWAKGVPLADIDDWLDLGLPERPWYQTGFVPMNLIPAEQAVAGEVLPPLAEGETEEETSSQLCSAKRSASLRRAEEPVVSSQSEQAEQQATDYGLRATDAASKAASAERLWKAWERSWAPLAKRMGSMYRAHYQAQERKLLKALKEESGREPVVSSQSEQAEQQATDYGLQAAGRVAATQSVIKDEGVVARILFRVFADPKGRAEFRTRVKAFCADAKELGLRQALSEAGLTGDELEQALKELLSAPQITEAITSDSIRISTRVNTYTRDVVRRQLSAGLEAGETPLQLADRVQDVMGGRRAAAVTTARNSVGQALSQARAVGRNKWATHETWIHSRGPGERRPGHVAAEGYYRANPKPVGEPFVVNGAQLRYPRDPAGPPAEIINCQCLAIGKRLIAPGAENVEDLAIVSYADMLAARKTGLAGMHADTRDEDHGSNSES